MSLPPGFLDELRTRTSLAQVAGRKVLWDSRKSNQGKGDLWAPCPFHQEKTASFHVDDRKGYYYCFGCHAKGDAISFVRETENVGFMEAVEILAGEAGMEMPRRDPQAQQKADRREILTGVMEQAVRFFRLQLQSAAGAEARAYLAGRGLGPETRERWEIGFAPPRWESLREALAARGVSVEDMLACGLVRASDKGRAPYDVFRNRIMFPIRDGRGRAIAFGGRAMDPEDNAKYLNSPETELFDKSRNLYNLGSARAACGKGHPLIVAEGYMDVIALSEAGFAGAVAPLGTAITEAQLRLMWRLSPEPVIALDGDKAGQRAAGRLVDLTLPLLSGGNSLFFLSLPGGQDPDDFLETRNPDADVRAARKIALARLIEEEKVPLVRALWEREFGAAPTGTPEQKAALDKRLRQALGQIPDADIKRYYGEALKQFRWEAFRPRNWAPEYRGRKRGRAAVDGPLPTTKASLLASGEGAANLLQLRTRELHAARERIVAALVASNPAIAEAFRDGLEQFDCADPGAQAVLSQVLGWDSLPEREACREALARALGPDVVAGVLNDGFVRIHPGVRGALPRDILLTELAENIARVTADRAAHLELLEAEEDIDHMTGESLTYRLGQSARERDEVMRGSNEDRIEYDIAPNGAQVDRRERGALEALLDQIRFEKPGRS